MICWIFAAGISFISCGSDDKDNPTSIDEPVSSDIDIREGMDLVGKIMDGTDPISDVIVSDGYSVTKTNADGVYQIKRNKAAKFVFISIPADCEILSNKNIPNFYKSINQETNIIRADFSLKKTEKKTNYTLVAIADPQASDLYEMSRFSNETVADIITHTKMMQSASSPLYGLVVGDLVWDRMDMFSDYINVLSKLSFPLFQVIGNHDHDQSITNNDSKAASKYETYFGPTYYSYNIGDCHYVVLDDVYYKNRDDYDGFITQEQLDWLKEDLKYVDKDKLIILGTHIPTKRRSSSTAVSNNQSLYDILNGYKVRIISGHTHHGFNTTISDNIEENTLGAACGAFWSGDVGVDGGPNGYAIYQISGNKITNWYFKGTNQNTEKQIKLYPQNSWDSRKTSIIANIWNWNYEWIVEVFEDNLSGKVMNKYTDYDPFAYDYMFGPSKPERHPAAAEPSKTDHLFYYTPSSELWSSIKVKATDSFGNVYEEIIYRNNQ